MARATLLLVLLLQLLPCVVLAQQCASVYPEDLTVSGFTLIHMSRRIDLAYVEGGDRPRLCAT